MDDAIFSGPPETALDTSGQQTLPQLYRAYIGPVNTAAYLERFMRLERSEGTAWSWHWPASLCTLNWLMFRHLWIAAALYLACLIVVPLGVIGAGRALLQWTAPVESMVLATCAVLWIGLPGLLGHRLYFLHGRQVVNQALAQASSLQLACDRLAQRAPTPRQLQILIGLNGVLIVLAALVYWNWGDSDTAAVAIAPAAPALPPVTLPQTSASHAAPAATATAAPAASAVSATPSSIPAAAASRPTDQASTPAVSAATTPPPKASPSAPTRILTVIEPAAPAPPPAPRARNKPSASPAAYVVNVGLFADPDNARRAYILLFKAGLPASREVIHRQGKTLTRVRSGPYANRAEALAAAQRIRALKLDAVLAKVPARG